MIHMKINPMYQLVCVLHMAPQALVLNTAGAVQPVRHLSQEEPTPGLAQGAHDAAG